MNDNGTENSFEVNFSLEDTAAGGWPQSEPGPTPQSSPEPQKLTSEEQSAIASQQNSRATLLREKAQREAEEQDEWLSKASGSTGFSNFLYSNPFTGPGIREGSYGFATQTAPDLLFIYGLWRIPGAPNASGELAATSGTSFEGASYRFTNKGQPIGRVPVPQNAAFGTTRFGHAMHEGLGGVFAVNNPDIRFGTSTARGLRGPDLAIDPRDVGQVGYSRVELKPNTQSGFNKYQIQLRNWEYKNNLSPGNVRAYTYDAQGNIYEGFQFEPETR